MSQLLRWASATLAAAVLLSATGLNAQDPTKRSVTWPQIITTVTLINGWIVAEGRASSQANQIMWRTPLAPAGPAVAMRHGWGSMFVEVGLRQFVVDDATGTTRELRPGQVVRQDLPWLPAYPTPYTSEGAPTAQPGGNLTSDNQVMLSEVNTANEHLMEALNRLDLIAQAYDRKQATFDQLQAARASVREARAEVDRAQRNMLATVPPDLRKLAAPKPAPATMPALLQPQPQDPQVAAAQKRLLDLTAQYVETQRKAEELYRAAGNKDTPEVLAARTEAARIGDQLDQADARLRTLRLVEDVDPCPIKVTASELSRIARLERTLLTINQDYSKHSQRVQELQEGVKNKTATSEELQAAQLTLIDTMKKMTTARRDLEDLRRNTCQAAMQEQLRHNPPATEPAAEAPVSPAG